MNDDIGDWYAKRAEEASRLGDELATLRERRREAIHRFQRARNPKDRDSAIYECTGLDMDIQKTERALERARYVGAEVDKRDRLQRGEQVIKLLTVYLRDEAKMDFGDVIHGITYCWRHTETVAMAEAREAKK